MILFMITSLRYVLVVSCSLIIVCNGCFVVATGPNVPPVESWLGQNTVRQAETVVKQEETVSALPESHGSGYLSEGPTVSVGLLDGEEELKILEKIKRLEKSLNKEKERRETLEQNLTDVKVAKEKVEEECSETKKELEANNKNLTEEMKVLDARIKDLEKKLAIAELKPKQLEEEVIKAQIAETKARQELFKLKIDQLEKSEDE